MNNETNAFTGNNPELYNRLKSSINNAESIDIIVSFLMESGVKLIINDLKEAISKGVEIRILTGNYLNITQPQALYLLRKELGYNLDLRFYNVANKSFHPKAYIFHNESDSEIYIGSSNLSKGALTDSIEWNYHFKRSKNLEDFDSFYQNFEDLFYNQSTIVDDEALRDYSKKWTKPRFPVKEAESIEEYTQTPSETLFEPRGPQIEALYALERSREEGFDKALVVAATGIGKTYLAAFDSIKYKKVLFIAHREEIIKQAAKSFKNVFPTKTIGFFYNQHKQTDKDMIFSLVQTLGKSSYLNDSYFKRDEFDYIVVDEFHHAVANNYKKILDYFKPKFLLGLTATPERLDNRDVFALCDYNNVYEIRLKEAINKGWLVPFRYYGIYDDTIDYSTVNMRNGRYDEKDLEEKLMINRRANLVYHHFLKYTSKSAIGFCASRNHAEYMASYFNEHGIAAASVYSGEQGEHSQNRQKAIDDLRDGKLRIIFTVDIFNEGLDLPSIDEVLFLRPTQSPTIFLQQLGRGLRKDKGKKYLTVLDFIGNYKKANMAPFLLSGKDYDSRTLLREAVLDFEYPEDCFIDFDFQLVDLFKYQAKSELKAKDRVVIEFNSVKTELDHRPSRVELFLHMDDAIIGAMKRTPKINLFKDYMSFLNDNKELMDEEEEFLNSPAHEFLKAIENTNMTKSYKMPILRAFYNNGSIKMAISDDDVYLAMKEFYDYGSNGVDMLKDKSSRDYKSWSKKDYVNLAKRNPIKFLKKTHGDFFIDKEGFALALADNLEQFINLDSFKRHFEDIIEYRTLSYYKDRFEKKQV
ncbi:DEAD/DEAH box helicase domain-containing protein [Methanobrevibacter ruminantium M1]|uniref:DEAD/DEAH box helicase domain-containing protein n=1 Tax=Methanobrevibacter ruminantium (strain ATCC 35063 / DSM 1093 / JCM 13430 / OCM 146 / M1) TaxID=634498 RepID=D3E268_METRM|nr:DEAD/DEAH box helicase family protein [Methanobrevibacter ruminantium]ADC46629.1 DEAD/DEAH box helicase domain-containing protein [Methanobrevibacter ruminantium M1]